MRVFLAGSTGVIGRRLLPMLVGDGHHVTALVRTIDKASLVERLGAEASVADALDSAALSSAVVNARPDVVLHELTALSDVKNFKQFDKEFALTNRLRTEVTTTLLNAAVNAGATRFIAQSFCGWPFARTGGPVKTEEDALDDAPPREMSRTLSAIRFLEDSVSQAVEIDGVVLRYGNLYGPGTAIADQGPIVELVRKRQMPLVGGGTGVWSFVHVDDAARATVLALTRGASGLYNIVDDDPAHVSEWLPALADTIGAKPPRRVPTWLAKLAIGDVGVGIMTTSRGGSNSKAVRDLRWELEYPSWRTGFRHAIG